MRCSNCGKELTAQDKFCSQCGKAVPPQDVFCSQCGKKLTAADKFCSQCGNPVASQAGSGSQAQQKTSPTMESVRREVTSAAARKLTDDRKKNWLEMLAAEQAMIASNDRFFARAISDQVKTMAAKSAVTFAANELNVLVPLKKIDQGIQHTPEPITTAEKRVYLQEALAVTEKAITPELQRSDSEKYSSLVQRKADIQAAIQKIDSGKATSRVIFCPHCNKWTDTDFTHCVHCYKSINPSAPRPVPQSGQQPVFAASTQSAPRPAAASRPAAAPQPATKPAPAPAPQAGSDSIRYADDSVKNWTMLPGEKSEMNKHAISMLQPAEGTFSYSMQVTNRRILLWRESMGSTVWGSVARMGGGLLGSLIAEGVKAAAGAGAKPWLEIPLTAVSSCGLQNKNEFFFVADQTYVLKNKNYERILPALVENAKR